MDLTLSISPHSHCALVFQSKMRGREEKVSSKDWEQLLVSNCPDSNIIECVDGVTSLHTKWAAAVDEGRWGTSLKFRRFFSTLCEICMNVVDHHFWKRLSSIGRENCLFGKRMNNGKQGSSLQQLLITVDKKWKILLCVIHESCCYSNQTRARSTVKTEAKFEFRCKQKIYKKKCENSRFCEIKWISCELCVDSS